MTEIAPNDDTTYNVAVTGMTTDGDVTVAVPAGGATDAATNTNDASTSTDATVTYDTTAPVVDSVVRADADPTNASSVDFTVTFSEAVTGVDVSDFDLTTTGSITGASVDSVMDSGDTYTVTVLTGSGDGTIRLDVLDDDTIIDAATNPLDGRLHHRGGLLGRPDQPRHDHHLPGRLRHVQRQRLRRRLLDRRW